MSGSNAKRVANESERRLVEASFAQRRVRSELPVEFFLLVAAITLLLKSVLLAPLSPLRAAPTGADFEARAEMLLTPTFFASPIEWSLRDDGRLYFEAFRQSTNANGLHLSGGPGGFQTLMESGGAAPELPGFTWFGPVGEWVAVDGGYAFGVGLDGPGVDSTNDYALYAGTASTGPRLVFREGDSVPTLPGFKYFFGATQLRVNDQGHVLFNVDLAPSGTALVHDSVAGGSIIVTQDGATDLGLERLGQISFLQWNGSTRDLRSGLPESPQVLFSEGDAAPHTTGLIDELRQVVNTSTTRRAFTARLVGGDEVVYSDLNPQQNVRLVHRTSLFVRELTANQHGQTAFIAGEFGADSILADQPGPTFTTIASIGDPAPGQGAGVTFGAFVGAPIINDFAQVAFVARLAGSGVTTSNDLSIWHHDPDFGLVIMAREGASIQIGLADTRTIQSLQTAFSNIHDVSLQDGAKKQHSRFGEVAFQANFTDGHSALLVARRAPAALIFVDGFESGDMTGWSATVP